MLLVFSIIFAIFTKIINFNPPSRPQNQIIMLPGSLQCFERWCLILTIMLIAKITGNSLCFCDIYGINLENLCFSPCDGPKTRVPGPRKSFVFTFYQWKISQICDSLRKLHLYQFLVYWGCLGGWFWSQVLKYCNFYPRAT